MDKHTLNEPQRLGRLAIYPFHGLLQAMYGIVCCSSVHNNTPLSLTAAARNNSNEGPTSTNTYYCINYKGCCLQRTSVVLLYLAAALALAFVSVELTAFPPPFSLLQPLLQL